MRLSNQWRVSSPNAAPIVESYRVKPGPEQITQSGIRDRWTQLSFFRKPPLQERLSGLEIEYLILEVFSRDSGPLAAVLGFDVGQGSQDIGFRNDISILFNAIPTRTIKLSIKDEKGKPTTASLTVRDRRDRLYPNPTKRLAPDFFFQPQVYREDQESLSLPDGYYTLRSSGGPEYLPQTSEFTVDSRGPGTVSIQLKRWIDPSQFGWYSGDPHIHAAGCSHYQKPTEGVNPEDMIRQIAGRGKAIAVGEDAVEAGRGTLRELDQERMRLAIAIAHEHQVDRQRRALLAIGREVAERGIVDDHEAREVQAFEQRERQQFVRRVTQARPDVHGGEQLLQAGRAARGDRRDHHEMGLGRHRI